MLQPLLLALTIASATTGDTTIVDYYGPHPLPGSIDHAMCWIEGPHVHAYEPEDPLLFVHDDDSWTFVGDPSEYEQASPSTIYYGHHPVTWTADYAGEPTHYCYISGPHHHWHAPPESAAWVEKGGAWWYVGARPVWYEERRVKAKRIDDHYAHEHVIVRPVVVVAPPVGWVGVTFGARGVSASIGFGRVEVVRPAPVYVQPVVIIEEHDHHHHRPPGHAYGHYKHKEKWH